MKLALIIIAAWAFIALLFGATYSAFCRQQKRREPKPPLRRGMRMVFEESREGEI